MEYWLSVGCCSVLSIRSSVRVVDVMDVDVADVEVALVLVDVMDVVDVTDVEVALVVVVVRVVGVVVCTKFSERFGHFNKVISKTTLGYSLKKLLMGGDGGIRVTRCMSTHSGNVVVAQLPNNPNLKAIHVLIATSSVNSDCRNTNMKRC